MNWSAVGRIAVSSLSGAAGGGLGTAAAKLSGVAVRLGTNTAGSGVIGATAAMGNQIVDGKEVTSDAVVSGAVTGAAFGAAGAVAGEVIGAVGKAVVSAGHSSLPAATKNLFDEVAHATPGTVVNTGQQAGPAAMAISNTASNAVSNSAPLVCGDGAQNCKWNG
jgi:hypothetical protein